MEGLKNEVREMGLRAEERLEPSGVYSSVGEGDQEVLWGGPQRRRRSLTQAPEPWRRCSHPCHVEAFESQLSVGSG